MGRTENVTFVPNELVETQLAGTDTILACIITRPDSKLLVFFGFVCFNCCFVFYWLLVFLYLPLLGMQR